MTSIAEAAGVAVDTVYASVGTKPELLRLLVETAVSGTDQGIPAEEREYVRAIIAEPDAVAKIRIYASAVTAISERMAPVFAVLREAAPGHPEVAEVWREIGRRRAANMLRFARELQATGRLRAGLSVEDAADVVWAMNAPDFWMLLVRDRGWSAPRVGAWLADAWQRLLLDGG